MPEVNSLIDCRIEIAAWFGVSTTSWLGKTLTFDPSSHHEKAYPCKRHRLIRCVIKTYFHYLMFMQLKSQIPRVLILLLTGDITHPSHRKLLLKHKRHYTRLRPDLIRKNNISIDLPNLIPL